MNGTPRQMFIWGDYIVRLTLLLLASVFLTGCAPTLKYYYFFSESHGKITSEGKPVAGAKVIRGYKRSSGSDTITDQVVSDGNGYFSFPAIREFSIVDFVHEPVISQNIIIEVEGRRYLAWKFVKRNYARAGEVYAALEFQCELSDPEVNHRIEVPYDEREYTGICYLRKTS